MGTLMSVCISSAKKSPARNIHQGNVVANGVSGDIHCGIGIKQVSLLPYDAVKSYFDEKGEPVNYGAFGENAVIQGLDWASLHVGDKIRCGEDVVLEITQLGASSEGYEGDKICGPMEALYIFCRVAHAGIMTEDDPVMLY